MMPDWYRVADEMGMLICIEGAIWNDRFGDGRDRYKSGGLTQSWLIPERRLTDMQWFEGRASGVEIQARGFVATPDNTNVVPAR